MGWKYVVAVVGIAVAILVRKFQIRLESLSLPPGYTYNDESCQLLGQARGLLGTEDLGKDAKSRQTYHHFGLFPHRETEERRRGGMKDHFLYLFSG